MFDIGMGELIVILIILLLLFGSTKLPKLARSIGESAGELKKGINNGMSDKDDKKPVAKTDSAKKG